MKNLFLLLFCSSYLLVLQAQTPQLIVIPAHPKPGETVRFEYDIAKGPLQKATEDIEVTALELSGETPEVKDILTQRVGTKISGQFSLSANANVAMLAFQAGERWDNNNGEGYFIQLCDATGKTLPQSLAAQAVLYRDWGGLFELNRKATVAHDWFGQAFAGNPSLRSQYFSSYITNLMAANRGDNAKAEALAVLEEVEKAGNLSEKDQMNLARLYERLSVPDKAAAIREDIHKKYPKGSMVRLERRQAMRAESDPAKLETIIEAFVKDFPPTTTEEKDEVSDLYFMLGSKAAEKKDWALVKKAAAKMNADNQASLYNNTAWELAENGEELEMARQMAIEATEWAKNEMAIPTQTKQPYQSQKTWDNNRKLTFAQYADTYAYVLDKLNDPGTAALYQAQVIELTKGENADMNERYTEYLEHSKAPDLRYQLEGFLIHGQASAKMRDQFKRLFASEDKSTEGTEAYLAGLDKLARANKKKEIAAKMMDQPAPDFQLKNLNGDEVRLADLKGKVVIIDFWATWCGPCKASFPGMQQTLNNLKDDPNVAFVFVDTWERAEDKAKNAADFIKSKGYTFNVLLDTEDKVVASFGITGIPTKFVIDKNGKIRFKSIGYAGSTEALVDELTAMIDLTKEQP